MPNESPIFCRCSLPHTEAEEAEARERWAALQADWKYIRKNPAYWVAPNGSLRPVPCPPFPGLGYPEMLPSYETVFRA